MPARPPEGPPAEPPATPQTYLHEVREQYESHPYPPRDPADEAERLERVRAGVSGGADPPSDRELLDELRPVYDTLAALDLMVLAHGSVRRVP